MKTRIIILLLLITTLAIPLSTEAYFDKNLSYGFKNNNQVKSLQEFLISKGYLKANANGNFFSLTLQAVKKLQADNNLPANGNFGPRTRQLVNNIIAKDNEKNISDKKQEKTIVNPFVAGISKAVDSSNLSMPPPPIPIPKTEPVETNVILNDPRNLQIQGEDFKIVSLVVMNNAFMYYEPSFGYITTRDNKWIKLGNLMYSCFGSGVKGCEDNPGYNVWHFVDNGVILPKDSRVFFTGPVSGSLNNPWIRSITLKGMDDGKIITLP